jgi:NAD(P)-dependent dehydrogenase (short-subunit alcohol dehydrogenase family)
MEADMCFSISLDGKRALVTGASSGLGEHFAGVLAGAGAKVAVAARRLAECERVCDAIRQASGQAAAIELDVVNAGSVDRCVSSAVSALGGLDILISNAGVTATEPALDLAEADWDRILDTNLKGAFLIGRTAARAMIPGGEGAIVNIASILGLRVAGQVSAYSAAKTGLIQLTKSMALEWARYGVRVNALCPGYVETDLNREFFKTSAGQALIKRIPQRRLAQMSDLDGALLLLCSDAGARITGAEIAVDGGHLISSL